MGYERHVWPSVWVSLGICMSRSTGGIPRRSAMARCSDDEAAHTASRTRITGLQGRGSTEAGENKRRGPGSRRAARRPCSTVQLLQSGRHSQTGWTRAYAAAAKALHNDVLHDMRENARPRTCHSPRPTRAGAICSYPQPLTLLCCPAAKTAALGGVKQRRPRPSRDPKYRG